MLAWLPLGIVLCFLAVGTFGEVLIQSNKANAAVYTTTVPHRLESRQESKMYLGEPVESTL